jgi:hypothetical protein
VGKEIEALENGSNCLAMLMEFPFPKDNFFVIQYHSSAVWPLQAGYHSQKGRFSAAGRSDQSQRMNFL